jgi:hypothetical protein
MERRSFIAGLGAASTIALAGCIGGGGSPDYVDWVSEPMLYEETRLTAVTPAEIASLEEFEAELTENDVLGITLADIEEQISLSGGASGTETPDFFNRFQADYDEQAVLEVAESEIDVTMEEAEEYSGFQLHEATDDNIPASEQDEMVLGFQDDQLLFANSRELIETAIDTTEGDVESLEDSQERFEEQADEVDFENIAYFRLDQALETAGAAFGGELTAEESELTYVVVAEDEETAESLEDQLVETVEEYDATVDDVTISGRVVELTVTAATQPIAEDDIAEQIVDDLASVLAEQ